MLLHDDRVARFRIVFYRPLYRRHQGRRHRRLSRFLRPADRLRPPQRLPAFNQKFIQPASRPFRTSFFVAPAFRPPSFLFFSVFSVLSLNSALTLSLHFHASHGQPPLAVANNKTSPSASG